MNNVTIVIAFVAGIVSFLSPCVLPIIPGFLAYLSGTSVAESARRRREIFFNSLAFVLGFSAVFAILGVLLNAVLASSAYSTQLWASRVGGVIIIVFGLYLTGLLKIPFLDREYKPQVTRRFNSRYFTSFVFGAAFAAGWTPCVGAVLGSILGLAATAPGSAFSLLLAYALGLGVPFLIVGLFTAPAAAFIARFGRAARIVNIVFGALLVVLGVLIFTQSLSLVANFSFLNSFLLR